MGKKVKEVDQVTAKEVRLEYRQNGTSVVITAHTGESNTKYEPADVLQTATFDAKDFPESFTTGSADVTKTLVAYGLQKLLQDRTSQVPGAANKIVAMVAEADRLKTTGQWSELKEREASAPRTPRVDTFLAQAIAEIKAVTVPAATAALAALSKEQRQGLLANPAVSSIVDRLKAEAKDAQASATDLADLLV